MEEKNPYQYHVLTSDNIGRFLKENNTAITMDMDSVVTSFKKNKSVVKKKNGF